MIENIASILEIEPDQINIKATAEGLGVTGRWRDFIPCCLNVKFSRKLAIMHFDPLEEERNCGSCSGCHKHS